MKLHFYLFCVFAVLSLYTSGQSIVTPATTAFVLNTSNQNASGFSVSGFGSSTLLVTIGLVNPPGGTTFKLMSTTGITPGEGYNFSGNVTRISFTGTQADVNSALSSLVINAGSVPGNVNLSVSATIFPAGYYYLPSNGHFYQSMAWPSGDSYKGGSTAYTNLLTFIHGKTFRGQTGYLVTITSSDEQNFINANVPGNNILIAITDRVSEGVFRIDDGPETGTIIRNGGNISGQYNNWCSNEPNNCCSGENYVLTKWDGSNCWNDQGPPTTNFPGVISGYVIEYGTWSDPVNQAFDDLFSGSVTHLIVCDVSSTPSAPVGVNGSRCSTGTVALSVSGVPAGSAVDWYAASGSNALLTGNASYTTPSISNTTTYYAQSRNTTTGCVSTSRTPVTATILPQFTTGTIYSTGETICNNTSPITVIGNTTSSSGGDNSIIYSWRLSADNYTAAISGATSATYTPAGPLTATTSYRRFARDGTCNITTTVSSGTWTVTVNQPSFSSGTFTVSSLQATGMDIKWYTASSGGSSLASGTVISNGTTYYASQIVNGVESTGRLAVTATIDPTPCAPSGVATQSGATLAEMAVIGSNIRWYSAATGGSALPASTSAVIGTTYYATQTVDCTESATRLDVTVTLQ